MTQEMVWLSVPIAALLSQLGGSDFAPKIVRRLGIALLMGAVAWYLHGFMWQVGAIVLLQYGAFTLPFTLIGDGVPDSAWNWAWIPVWAGLICSQSLWVSLDVWPVVIAASLVLAAVCALSNVKITAKWFPWKFCEMFIGACPLTVMCLTI